MLPFLMREALKSYQNQQKKMDSQLKAREKRKRNKYAKLLSGGGTTSPTLVPLVFEHLGKWDKKQKDI